MKKTVLLSIRATAGLMWDSWNPAIGLLHAAGLDVIDARSPDTIDKETLKRQVVDADGLNAVASQPEHALLRSADRILTPHPGEFARLAGEKPRGDAEGASTPWQRRRHSRTAWRGSATTS